MTITKDMTPNAELILLLMYEFQHMAGQKSILRDEIAMHYADAIVEFGSIEKAVEGVKERVKIKRKDKT